MLAGLNIPETVALTQRVGSVPPVIASGGAGSVEDLAALKRQAVPGLEGVVVGRALYDGRITIAAALCALADWSARPLRPCRLARHNSLSVTNPGRGRRTATGGARG